MRGLMLHEISVPMGSDSLPFLMHDLERVVGFSKVICVQINYR